MAAAVTRSLLPGERSLTCRSHTDHRQHCYFMPLFPQTLPTADCWRNYRSAAPAPAAAQAGALAQGCQRWQGGRPRRVRTQPVPDAGRHVTSRQMMAIVEDLSQASYSTWPFLPSGGLHVLATSFLVSRLRPGPKTLTFRRSSFICRPGATGPGLGGLKATLAGPTREKSRSIKPI